MLILSTLVLSYINQKNFSSFICNKYISFLPLKSQILSSSPHRPGVCKNKTKSKVFYLRFKSFFGVHKMQFLSLSRLFCVPLFIYCLEFMKSNYTHENVKSTKKFLRKHKFPSQNPLTLYVFIISFVLPSFPSFEI